jgi:DNA-binding SARP family transcriptional activator
LAGLFWGDYSQERARRCLNTALWRLRQTLEPEERDRGTYLLTTSTGEVGFNWESDHWLDVTAFEAQAGQILAKPVETLEADEVQRLQNALQLYTGDLLEGFYEDWALRERDRQQRLYLNSLAHLMDYYKQHGAIEASLAWGRQILEHDPLREEIHREMMRLYLENGQRALAARQYETCRQLLATELDLPPMEETQRLYNQIGATATPLEGAASPAEEPASYQQALRQLQMAQHTFDEARARLQRAILLFERITKSQEQTKPTPK